MNKLLTFALGAVVGAAAAALLPHLAGRHGAAHTADSGSDDGATPLTHAEATFRFVAEAPMARVAPLFGADRERVWAPGWAPRFLHPASAADQEGMVFAVRHGHSDAVWVNTRLDLAAGIVQYVYVLPDRLATQITLHLVPDGARTHVEVTYARTALRAAANAHVDELAAHDRAAGPEWAQQINDYLRRHPA